MDTMSAFMVGQAARTAGAKMTYFDGVKIEKIMKKERVTEAVVWLSGDRGYTQTPIKLHNSKLIGESMGVDGSIWATPMLEVNGDEYKVGTKDKKHMTIKWLDWEKWEKEAAK